MTTTNTPVWHAKLQITVGNKRVNRFLHSADLGTQGVYTKYTIVVSWKPEEEVDDARIETFKQKFLEDAKSDKDFEIIDIQLVKLWKE